MSSSSFYLNSKLIHNSSLSEGAKVFFCARTSSAIEATIQSLLASSSRHNITGTVVDVSSPSQIADWIKEANYREGWIDVVVSNVSSISVTDTPEAWNTAFSTDIQGTVNLIQAALPHLEKRKGSIVTISSVSGRDVDFTAPSPYAQSPSQKASSSP